MFDNNRSWELRNLCFIQIMFGVVRISQLHFELSIEMIVFAEKQYSVTYLPVLVVRMLLHVQGSQSFGFINERSLLRLRQQLPLSSKAFGYLAVVHLGILLSHLPPLTPRPDHKGIHGSLDSVGVLGVVQGLGSRSLDVVVVWRRGGHGSILVRVVGQGWGGLGQLGLAWMGLVRVGGTVRGIVSIRTVWRSVEGGGRISRQGTKLTQSSPWHPRRHAVCPLVRVRARALDAPLEGLWVVGHGGYHGGVTVAGGGTVVGVLGVPTVSQGRQLGVSVLQVWGIRGLVQVGPRPSRNLCSTHGNLVRSVLLERRIRVPWNHWNDGADYLAVWTHSKGGASLGVDPWGVLDVSPGHKCLCFQHRILSLTTFVISFCKVTVMFWI